MQQKFEKSLERGSRGWEALGGGKKVRKEFKTSEKVSKICFESVFHSLEAFSAPAGAGDCGNPFRDFVQTFSQAELPL